ncbi:MAG: hypothetical protein F6K30_14605, partial [Cyanothece sp. SIO2G6]|nr:hypothetical protein [Cyanothece sp. SIO2G6]
MLEFNDLCLLILPTPHRDSPMTPSTQTRSPETDTIPPAVATIPESEADRVTESATGDIAADSAGGTWLKVFMVLALLGAGAFFAVKPLVQALRDDPPLPQPRRTVASREDFPLVNIPSSSRSPNLQGASVGNVEIGTAATDETAATIPNSVTVPQQPSSQQSSSQQASEQVQLLPPGSPQPGTVEAP